MAKVKFRTPLGVMKKWLSDLRSGKFTQAQGCLRECYWDASEPMVAFCCLGVLQDIAVRDGGPAWDAPNGPDGGSGIPLAQISEYLGLTENMTSKLIEMNDDDGKDFNQIADYIEFTIMPELNLK